MRGWGVTGSDSQIYEEVKDDLVRYATALVGPDAAADVVSTVIVRVLSRSSLASLREPRPYLFRAVLHESISVQRRGGRWSAADTFVADHHDVPNLHPEVLDAVRDLPVRQRAATFLFYWAGCTVSETADLMGVGPGTVKRYLSLARTKLKEVLHART